MKRYCILTVVAIALAACAGTTAPSTSPLASPVATPTVAPDPIPGFPNTSIVYRREGGFVGKSDEWTIYPTGRIVAGNGTEWQVPAEQVAPLFELVEAPGFGDLNEKYAPAGTCNDCYTHTLTVYGQGEPQSVTFVDGADWPAQLQQALAEINKSIAR
jgi:hypothetical protein